jgi:hypothetical protein
MPMTLDLTTLTTVIEVKLAPLFVCPYCRRSVRSTQRMNYPPEAVGVFPPIYRCHCGKFMPEPMRSADEHSHTP